MSEKRTPPELEKFKERLEVLRKQKNLTQKQLAEDIEVSTTTISSYEKGYKSPSAAIVKKIAEKYDVSMDWLCGLSEKVQSADFKTYEDLFRQIINMHTVLGKHIKNNAGEDYNSFKIDVSPRTIYGVTESYWIRLSFIDEVFYTAISDYNTMTELFINRTISQDVYNLWLDGKMKELSKLALKDFGKSPFDDDDLPF